MTLGFRVDFHFMRASEKQLVEAILATWIFEQDPSQIERLATDGKVLRGTGRTDGKPLASLSLVTHQLRTTLRSVRIAEKSNEIPPPRHQTASDRHGPARLHRHCRRHALPAGNRPLYHPDPVRNIRSRLFQIKWL
jgi:hypothetical protein